MYFGCQCSSARCSRLLLDRLTLLGILSAEIMLRPLPVEFRAALLAVDLQRALVADRVRPLEDPVLPGGQPAENLSLHRLGAGEAEICFEAGHRVGRECRPGLDRDTHFVVPVDLVWREGDEPR